MKLTQPKVVSTTAALHGNDGHYRRTVATTVQYRMRGSIIPARQYPTFDRSGHSIHQHRWA
jgi:hypothetical protein